MLFSIALSLSSPWKVVKSEFLISIGSNVREFHIYIDFENMASCTLREVKSVRDTIRFYEDEILNYFDGRKTNASAESLNSKIKCFRAQVKGVIDMPFFMYRLATVLG